ncbi:MAG: acyltransferase [Bacteroidota bacterium]
MNPLQKEISLVAYFRSRFWIWFFNKMPNHASFDGMRCQALRWSGFKIKNRVKIFSPLSISPKTRPGNIELDGFLFINSGARFSAPGNTKIKIGQSCLVGPNVSFETVNHGLEYKPNKARGAFFGDIVLEEGVWVGCNAVILQKVTIGKGSVVAAASVVTKSVKSHTVVGGIPAKPIKDIYESEQ